MRPPGSKPPGSRTGTSVSPALGLLEFLARNGIEWVPPSADETVAMIERVATGEVSKRELADGLRATSQE